MSHLSPLEKVLPVAYFIVAIQQGLCLFPSFFLLQFSHCFFKDSISEPLVKFIVTINVHFGNNIFCYETEYTKVWRLHRFSKFYKLRCMTVSTALLLSPSAKIHSDYYFMYVTEICLHASYFMPFTNVFLTYYLLVKYLCWVRYPTE